MDRTERDPLVEVVDATVGYQEAMAGLRTGGYTRADVGAAHDRLCQAVNRYTCPAPAADDTGRETAATHDCDGATHVGPFGTCPHHICQWRRKQGIAPAPVPAAAAPTMGALGQHPSLEELAGEFVDRLAAAAPTDEGRGPVPFGHGGVVTTGDLRALGTGMNEVAQAMLSAAASTIEDANRVLAQEREWFAAGLAAAAAVPGDEREALTEWRPSHNYLNVERCPQSLGDAMRLIGRYTESEGGKSAETMQARTDLFDAYETWCQLNRPEGPAVPAERADEGRRVAPYPERPAEWLRVGQMRAAMANLADDSPVQIEFPDDAMPALYALEQASDVAGVCGTDPMEESTCGVLLIGCDPSDPFAARSVPVSETGERG